MGLARRSALLGVGVRACALARRRCVAADLLPASRARQRNDERRRSMLHATQSGLGGRRRLSLSMNDRPCPSPEQARLTSERQNYAVTYHPPWFATQERCIKFRHRTVHEAHYLIRDSIFYRSCTLFIEFNLPTQIYHRQRHPCERRKSTYTCIYK